MSVSEAPLPAKAPARLPVISENALLVAIAIGFLVVHILAGTMLLRAPAGATGPLHEETRPSAYD